MNIAGGPLYRTPQQPRKLTLPFLTEIHLSRKRSTIMKRNHAPEILKANATAAVELPPPTTDHDTAGQSSGKGECTKGSGVIKTGTLSKTTLSGKENSRPGQTRHRHFRLTEEALEYFHQFSHVSQD